MLTLSDPRQAYDILIVFYISIFRFLELINSLIFPLLDTGQLTVPDPEAWLMMILHELACRSPSVELQGDEPAPHAHHQGLTSPGPVVGAEGATTESVVTRLTGLAEAARYLEVVLDAVLGGHPRSSEGVRLEVPPFLQHERPVCCELDLTGLGSSEDTDPVVLVGEVLPPAAVVVERLDGGHRVEIVLETPSRRLQCKKEVSSVFSVGCLTDLDSSGAVTSDLSDPEPPLVEGPHPGVHSELHVAGLAPAGRLDVEMLVRVDATEGGDTQGVDGALH